MLPVEFHPDVAIEIKSSYQWYESQADGLGHDYLSEPQSSFETIGELPETWPRFQVGFRRLLLSKFPFSIIYKTKKTFMLLLLCTTAENQVTGPKEHKI